jgi:hypothetical protein
VGKKVQGRSTKKNIKPVENKEDTLDEQTKAEKEYLGPELFQILQEVKIKIERGELEDPIEEENAFFVQEEARRQKAEKELERIQAEQIKAQGKETLQTEDDEASEI